MPVYEYKCPNCNTVTSLKKSYQNNELWFGKIITTVPGLKAPICADCEIEMKRLFSAPAVIIH